MNKAQKAAYARPCFEAEETTNPVFHWGVRGKGGRFVTLTLTANIGLE